MPRGTAPNCLASARTNFANGSICCSMKGTLSSKARDPDIQMLIVEVRSAVDEMQAILFRDFGALNDHVRRGEQGDTR